MELGLGEAVPYLWLHCQDHWALSAAPPRRGTKLVSQESVRFNIDSFQALSHPDLVLTANPQQAGQALLVLG